MKCPCPVYLPVSFYPLGTSVTIATWISGYFTHLMTEAVSNLSCLLFHGKFWFCCCLLWCYVLLSSVHLLLFQLRGRCCCWRQWWKFPFIGWEILCMYLVSPHCSDRLIFFYERVVVDWHKWVEWWMLDCIFEEGFLSWEVVGWVVVLIIRNWCIQDTIVLN